MGTAERTLAKQILRTGGTLPKQIANAPELRKGLELYLNAFFELDSERTYGMAATRIPFTAVLRYAKHYEFDFEQTDFLLFFVREMDNAYLARMKEKSET